jgi:hypothetical protein
MKSKRGLNWVGIEMEMEEVDVGGYFGSVHIVDKTVGSGSVGKGLLMDPSEKELVTVQNVGYTT